MTPGKRLLAAVISLFLLVVALAACNGDAAEPSESTQPATDIQVSGTPQEREGPGTVVPEPTSIPDLPATESTVTGIQRQVTTRATLQAPTKAVPIPTKRPDLEPTPRPVATATSPPEAIMDVALSSAVTEVATGGELKVNFTVTNQSSIPAFDVQLEFQLAGNGSLISASAARGECEEAVCRINSFDGRESVTGNLVVILSEGFEREVRVDADVSWELSNSRRSHSYADITVRRVDSGQPGDLVWLTVTEARGGSCGARTQVGPDAVYAGFARKLYALSRDGGRVLWVAESDTTMFHPYLAGGNIYLDTRLRQRPLPDLGYIRSLNAATGQLNWEHEIEGQIRGPGVLYGNSLFYIVNIQRPGSILWQYHLLALDASTGKPKWDYPVGQHVNTPAMEFDGIIYFGTYSGGTDFLYAIDPESGELKRQYQLLDGAYATPLITEDTIYAVSGYGELRSTDLAEGQENWVYGTDGRASRTPVLSNGNVASLIYYPEENEFLSIEGIDAATGHFKWRYRPGEPLTQPMESKGSIYVPSATRLVSLDAETGSVKWEGDYRSLCSPPVLVDGVLYGRATFNNDFLVYAIRGE